MKPRTLTATKLLATAGLSVAYVAIAVLSAHPRVDAEYRSNYLDHTATCWIPLSLRVGDPAATLPASLQLGQLGYPAACRILRLGWYDVEDWGVWARTPDAILRLPRRPGAQAVELTLRAAPPPGPTIRVRFVLNGHVAEDELQPGTTKTIAFPLPPAGEPYDPDMRLTFFDHAAIPDPWRAIATRDVGLGLVTIRYLPEAAAGSLQNPGAARPAAP